MSDISTKLGDADAFLDLCHHYSIDPPSFAQGTRFAATRTVSDGSKFDGFEHNLVDDDQRVAHVNLVQNTKHEISPNTCGAAGSLQVKAQIAEKAGWYPAWFLPWNNKGAAVEMTIPRSTGKATKDNPDIFFTAALSGCSVMFKGSAGHPTILHGGSEQTVIPYDANKFWKDFVRYLSKNPDEATAASRTGKVRGQAVKNQYVVGESVQTPDGRTVKTTRDALDFKGKLESHYGDKVQILEVIPWGAVMGVRKNNNWTFYLQENANILYYPTRKIQQVLAYTKLDDRPQTSEKIVREMGPPRIVSRPMAMQQVFPDGGGKAAVKGRWRSLLRRDQLPDLPNAYCHV